MSTYRINGENSRQYADVLNVAALSKCLPVNQSLAVLNNEPWELIMTEHFDSAIGVFRKSNDLDSDPSDPLQRCASSGNFALRRALYFQRNLLNFQRDGTEIPAQYKTTTNVHELFP